MSIFNKEPRDRTESAELLEKRKTPEGRAEDIAYTINHAIVCAATDIIDPFFASFMQEKFNTGAHLSWCNKTHDHSHEHDTHKSHSHDDSSPHSHDAHDHHDHSHHHEHKHDSHDHQHGASCGHDISEDSKQPVKKRAWASLKHWAIGEAIGDLGAVPITIAAQRYAPGMMSSIGHSIEHVVGNDYRSSAKKASRKWAEKQGIDFDDERVKERENDIYNHEIDHFGQVGVWTASSVGLNIGSQKLLTGNKLPMKTMLLYKTLGAAQTAGILMAGRAQLPEQFHNFDRWTTKNIYLPTTKLIGLDSDAVENVIQKHEDLHGHAKHSHNEQQASPTPQPTIAAQDASSNVLIPEHLQR